MLKEILLLHVKKCTKTFCLHKSGEKPFIWVRLFKEIFIYYYFIIYLFIIYLLFIFRLQENLFLRGFEQEHGKFYQLWLDQGLAVLKRSSQKMKQLSNQQWKWYLINFVNENKFHPSILKNKDMLWEKHLNISFCFLK